MNGVYATGSDKIKVGLIGCGSRGTDACSNILDAAEGVEIAAMADLFEDRLNKSLNFLRQKYPERIKVKPETCFLGFDSYQKLLACDVNLVFCTTPPHWRPEHLRAVVEAGKHAFIEKPVGVDPAAIRSIIDSADLAKQKGLAILAGTQRRHQNHYLEIMKRIQEGDLGEIVDAQCYWVQGSCGHPSKKPEWSEMEWQIRNWWYFTWLSGDHICEQHVHNIDVINWAMGAPPKKAMGMGGRQVRTGPEYGNVFDHFAVEFEYPNGVRMLSMCRQIPGCAGRIAESIVGTKGRSYTHHGGGFIKGAIDYKYEGEWLNPAVCEHVDLVKSIREGKPINEGRQIAESTLTAIIGRMSAYTGRELSWEWIMNSSKLRLGPEKYKLDEVSYEPVAIPGKTKLI